MLCCCSQHQLDLEHLEYLEDLGYLEVLEDLLGQTVLLDQLDLEYLVNL